MINRAVQIILSLAFTALTFVGGAQAQTQCDSNDAMATAHWNEFWGFVKDNYNISGESSRNLSYAIGHAYGRYATAVQGEPIRETGFACIDLAIQQAEAQAQVQGTPGLDYRIFQEASMGYHNDVIARRFGVTSSEPLHGLMDRVYGPVRQASTVPPRSNSGRRGQSTMRDPFSDPPVAIVSQGPLSNTYHAGDCTSYSNFNLKTARSYLVQAERERTKFVNKYGESADCTGDRWYDCRAILEPVEKAQVQVDQVFEGNLGPGRCRNCDFNRVYNRAKDIYLFEQFLTSRYFSTAGGVGNLYSKIEGYVDAPICRESQSSLPHLPVWDREPVSIQAETPGSLTFNTQGPGWYVVKTSGSGYEKKYGGVAYFRQGEHISVFEIKDDKTLSQYFEEWQARERNTTQSACKKGPSPWPGYTPSIWVDGPHYTVLEGPYASVGGLDKKYRCDRADGVRVCVRWLSENRPYSEADAACGK